MVDIAALVDFFRMLLLLPFNPLFFKVVIFPGFTSAAVAALVLIWVERKFVAKMQQRVGPQYAGRLEGVLQLIADGIKLILKEIILPEKADTLLFIAAPVVAMALSATVLAVIPFSETYVVAAPDVGLLVVFAVLAYYPINTLVAAWASNSKYPFIGGVRALFQLVSYEIPLLISALGVAMLGETLNLLEIARAQASIWFILLQPVGAVAFYVASLAEAERIPFDLPEAESELTMGWVTEYSGLAFGLTMFASYVKLYAASALFTTLYLGAWHGPPILPPEAWFLIKTFAVAMVAIILRGVNPRTRIDLLLRIGWVKLMALSFLNLGLTLFLVEFGVKDLLISLFQ